MKKNGFEIYSSEGLPCFVEFDGTLEQLLNRISVSKWIYGRNSSELQHKEAIHVDFGNNVSHVSEATREDWADSSVTELE